MIHFYVKRETAGDGTLWQAFRDDTNKPVCAPTTEAVAFRVARVLSIAEENRAYGAASPYEREAMGDTRGT